MNWFKSSKTIKRSDVEQLFNTGSSNAKKILTKLVSLNLLQRTGDGPSTYYTLK
jgi:Fic family protein